MATNVNPKLAVATAEASPPEANVDKIRDILFGSQMRDYEKRFSRLEDHLAKKMELLREEFKKRTDSLESFVKDELESVNQRLKNEKSERTESIRGASKDIKESSKALEKRLAQLEDATTQAHGEIRKMILDQSKTLVKEIEQKRKELSDALDREVTTLTTEKTDRAALADLLTEMAMRLKDEFSLPEQ